MTDEEWNLDLAVNLIGGTVFGACQRSLANFGRLAIVGYVDRLMSAEIDLEAAHGKRHEIFGSGGGAKVAELAQAPLLGQIPLEPGVREWGDAGTPVVQAAPARTVAAASSAAVARTRVIRARRRRSAAPRAPG